MGLTEENKQQLKSLGWTVVQGVVSEADCDRHQTYLRQWLSKFKKFPQNNTSLIQRYRAAHLLPAWEVRLAAKDTFANIWGTNCLLTSTEGIGIGRPPEESSESFMQPQGIVYRNFQTADKEGLHAYKGVVFLEHCDEADWTYEVLEGSHNYAEEFSDTFKIWKTTYLTTEHIDWFVQCKGLRRIRVKCPKGGMLLVDARLFLADVRPWKNRENPGRWRFIVHVCMTPASWATESDLAVKKKAYESMAFTNDWPSQRVAIVTVEEDKSRPDPYPYFEMPEIACSEEVKKLVGVVPYGRFENEETDFVPSWNDEKWEDLMDRHQTTEHLGASKRIIPRQ